MEAKSVIRHAARWKAVSGTKKKTIGRQKPEKIETK